MKKELIKLIEDELNLVTIDTRREVFKIKSIIPDYLLDLSMDYDFLIAGGMITSIFTGNKVNDIDIYLTDKNQHIDLVLELLANGSLISATPRSFMINHSGTLLNVVYYKTFEDANDIFKSFDFTLVMGAYSPRYEKFILHKHFLRDNAKKEIVFEGDTDFPIASMLRVKKYTERGYFVQQKTMLAVILKCMQLNIKTYEELESQVGGMYGLDLSKMIDTDKDFDLNVVVQDIVNGIYDINDHNILRYMEDSDIKRKRIMTELFKDIEIKVFKAGNHVYRKVGDRLIRAGKEIKEAFVDKAEDLTGKVLLYKFVRKTDQEGVYESYYKKEFLYKINELAIDETHGLWGGCLNEHERFTNSNKSDRVLIELRVDASDIKKHDEAQMNFSKAEVVREMKGKYQQEKEEDMDWW